MTEDIMTFLDGNWAGSVSSGNAADLSGVDSVSSGDAAGVTYYQINLYSVSGDPADGNGAAAPQELQYTLWDKPLENYTVTEGLLLILVVIAVAVLVWQTIKGGFKWQK